MNGRLLPSIRFSAAAHPITSTRASLAQNWDVEGEVAGLPENAGTWMPGINRRRPDFIAVGAVIKRQRDGAVGGMENPGHGFGIGMIELIPVGGKRP